MVHGYYKQINYDPNYFALTIQECKNFQEERLEGCIGKPGQRQTSLEFSLVKLIDRREKVV